MGKGDQEFARRPRGVYRVGRAGRRRGAPTEATLLLQKTGKILDAFAENPKRKQALQARYYSAAAGIDEARLRLERGASKLEAWVKADPKNVKAHDRLGRALFNLQDAKAAYAEFQLAAEADKKHVPAEIALCELYTDPVNSDKWLNAAIKKGANDLRSQVAIASYLLKANRLDEAKSHAAEALKLDPDGTDANLISGIVERMNGDYEAAVEHLSKAHLHTPANPVVMNHLALALAEMPDQEHRQQALEFAEINNRQNPNLVNVVLTLGWVNYRLNRRAEAERAFKL